MDTEIIREWINDIWAYCEENTTAVLACAGIAFILLLSAGMIMAAKREDRKYLREKEAAEAAALAAAESEPSESSKSAETVPVQEEAEGVFAEETPAEDILPEETPSEEVPEEETSVEELPGEEIRDEEIPVEEVLPAAPAEDAGTVCCDAARDVVETLVKTMEAAACASGQKVESIELKIEKAQLTIHYAGEETEQKKSYEPKYSETDAASADVYPSDRTRLLEEALMGHTDDKELPKRFGSDNMNTAHSGRVYTEEELLNQIRE